MGNGDPDSFCQAIKEIERLALERGLSLVVRDWSHIDFNGWPLDLTPPLTSSWSSLLSDLGSGCRVATVRHPLDQFLALKSAYREQLNDDAAWQGILAFAREVQPFKFWRYEDFVANPAKNLIEICAEMNLTYDDAWQNRWYDWSNITGSKPVGRAITAAPRAPVAEKMWRALRRNQMFCETLDLLGYPMPFPLRRFSFSYGPGGNRLAA